MRGCDLKLDWLSFTYKATIEDLERDGLGFTSLDSFMLAFPELEDIWCDTVSVRAVGFYSDCVVFNDNIRFSWNDGTGYVAGKLLDMGVNVSIPSHSLEWFFGLFNIDINSSSAITELFTILNDRNCKPSRIDLCFDDFEKKYTPQWYAQRWDDESLVSRFQKAKIVTSRQSRGWTFYLGDRKCNKLMRIYDKEFESKGLINSIRYEFEVHGNNAKDMFNYFLNHNTIDFFGYLLSWFRVVVRTNDSNKARSALDSDWVNYFSDLLQESVFCEDIKHMVVKIPKYSQEERKMLVSYWLEHYCLNDITGYIKVYGWERLHELVSRNKSNIPNKYLALLNH